MKKQSRWFAALPSTEYAINLALTVAIGLSPFELVYGRRPGLFPLPEIEGEGEHQPVHWLTRREGEWAEARDRLWVSRVRQAIQYNKRRRKHVELEEGDWVLLEAKNRGVTSG